MLVFCPSTRAAARDLRGVRCEDPVRLGYAPTPGLREAVGLGPGEDDEAEFVALTHAGVAALVTTDEPLRLVLAVDVAGAEISSGEHEDLGEVRLRGLHWAQVTALFADEESARPAVARTRAGLGEISVAEALESEAVRTLLQATDLLWYDPSELDHVPGGQ